MSNSFEQLGHALSNAEQAARRGKLIRAGTVVVVQTIVEHRIRLCEDEYSRELGESIATDIKLTVSEDEEFSVADHGDILESRCHNHTVDPQPSEAERHPPRPH